MIRVSRCLSLLLLGLWLLGFPSCGESEPASVQHAAPGLLLIVADDLGRSDVGFLGGSLTTPSIDRIAREGIALDRFYAASTCSPTRAALLTGRSPANLGLLSVVRPWEDRGLDLGQPTLAEVLRERGFATALVGKWHLGHMRRAWWPQMRGFDHFYGSLGGSIDYFTHERKGTRDWQRNGESLDESGYATDLVAAEALSWLRRVEADRPFFLMVSFHAPHPPRQAPVDRLEKFAALPDSERVYAAMVDALDSGTGLLLDELDRSGRAENTLVVFVSDNGAGSEDRTGGLRGDKGSTYEGGMRAPAAIRYPAKLGAGGRSEQVLRSEDLFATVLDAIGVEPKGDAKLDGRSFWSSIAEGGSRSREALYFVSDSREGRERAVLDGRFKRVERFGEAAGTWTGETFDIETDPGESSPLGGSHDELHTRLRGQLADWFDRELGGPARRSSLPPASWETPADWTEAAD